VQEDRTLDVQFDPCQPLQVVAAADATLEEADSTELSLTLWRAVAAVDFQNTQASQQILVRFQHSNPSFHGGYQDELGEIVINRSVTDRAARAVVIAHELGHAFGLYHVDNQASVMQPGNLTTAPTERDGQALAQTWGS
jgi:Zn-dependent peptidase ImmA (M78 family)